MILKQILYFGQPMAVACDAKCSKAWGVSSRPSHQLSDKEDDTEWLSDDELGDAPDDPGTYEGECAKPRKPEDRMNKWCVRECERCASSHMGDRTPKQFTDFSKRVPNITDRVDGGKPPGERA